MTGKVTQTVLFLLFLTASASAVFIRAQGMDFVDNQCAAQYYNGWNGWMVVEDFLPSSSNADRALYLMDTGLESGLKIARIFAHGVTRSNALQTSPGEYDQSMFEALDRVLVELKKRDMKAILSLSSYWAFTDGPQQYVAWVPNLDCDIAACYEGDAARDDWAFDDCVAQRCPERDKFYIDPRARELYRNHIRAMTSRVNVFTGVAYKDDDTIFSWNLMNEPNCRTEICTNGTGLSCALYVHSWISEMSQFLKTQDPNHMVTVGEDGMYGPAASADRRATNPDLPPARGDTPTCPRGWSSRVGQDFVRNHALPSIDYAGIHVWPDNWLPNASTPYMLDFFTRYLDRRIRDAGLMNKPILVEEFGKVANWTAEDTLVTRDPFYATVYATQLYRKTTPLKGSLFWQFSGPPDPTKPPTPGRSVSVDDTTWPLIASNAQQMNALTNSYQVVDCVPTSASHSYPGILVPAADIHPNTYFISRGDGWVVQVPNGALSNYPQQSTGRVRDCATACQAAADACTGFTFSASFCVLHTSSLLASFVGDRALGVLPSTPGRGISGVLQFSVGATTYVKLTNDYVRYLGLRLDLAEFSSTDEAPFEAGVYQDAPTGLVGPDSESPVLLAEAEYTRPPAPAPEPEPEEAREEIGVTGEVEASPPPPYSLLLPPLAAATPAARRQTNVTRASIVQPTAIQNNRTISLIGDTVGGPFVGYAGNVRRNVSAEPPVSEVLRVIEEAEAPADVIELATAESPEAAAILEAVAEQPTLTDDDGGGVILPVLVSNASAAGLLETESASQTRTPPFSDGDLLTTSRGRTYSSHGVGQVAVEEGETVRALGFETDFITTASPRTCATQCDLVPECNAFSLNTEQEKCFLKSRPEGADEQTQLNGDGWTTYFVSTAASLEEPSSPPAPLAQAYQEAADVTETVQTPPLVQTTSAILSGRASVLD